MNVKDGSKEQDMLISRNPIRLHNSYCPIAVDSNISCFFVSWELTSPASAKEDIDAQKVYGQQLIQSRF